MNLARTSKTQQDAESSKIFDIGLSRSIVSPVGVRGSPEQLAATVRVLLWARRLIFYKGWTQWPTHGLPRETSNRYTLLAALKAACSHEYPSDQVRAVQVEQFARKLLYESVGIDIPKWNDELGRTREQVLDALESAIRRAGHEPPYLDRGGWRTNSPYRLGRSKKPAPTSGSEQPILKIIQGVREAIPTGDVPREVFDSMHSLIASLLKSNSRSGEGQG